ncbi:glycoside hydrolase [Mycena vulgaris]|nr:glycoside hydrolase [Mycena vulgaris]
MARLGFFASSISVFLALRLVQAVPFNATLGERAQGLSPVARNVLLSARAVPTSPRWVVYFDRFISSNSLPAASALSGFNVFALSFIYSASLQDNAATWAQLDAATRATIKAEYAAADISLIVSAYGAGPNPTSAGDDPTAAANFIANYVKTFNLDGVDVDYADFGAIENAGTAVAWLSTFTRALRAQLPQGQYILTHAPVAPWFSPATGSGLAWLAAGFGPGLENAEPEPDKAKPKPWLPGQAKPAKHYLGVNSAVGSLIDWYNVQSSVFQIAANGVSLNKIVIDKPATAADATNGFMDPGTFSTCLAQAKAQGWGAGAMTWQYPNGNSAWVTQVRSGSFPVGGSGGGGTTTTSRTTTSSPGSTSTPPSGGSCSGAAAWSSSDAYPAGSVVTSGGFLWTANQWNFNEAPGGADLVTGAWDKTANCNGVFHPATATAVIASAKATKATAA